MALVVFSRASRARMTVRKKARRRNGEMMGKGMNRPEALNIKTII
jgi:hypothetical protein